MAVYTELPQSLTEVDVIIVGGGTAACIIASRLSDADAELTVLVIESGPDNLNDPAVVHPLLFLSHLLPTSKRTIFYQGTAEAQLGGRKLVVPSGGSLGGGSSINLMMYSRAQRSDWNDWGPGWSAEEMIPYLKKLETYHGPNSGSTHGLEGPTLISGGTYRAHRSENDFIQAANKVGYPEIEDLQDLDSNNGVQRALRFIGPDGKRQDTAHRYLHPRLQDGKHPNLMVLVESQVLRILFQGTKASGIEYQPNPAFQSSGTKKRIAAKKMVIVSAGALGTPLVLEKSGVGDPEVLKRASVPVVAEVPGVGKEYQDHHLLAYPYHTSLDADETVDALTGGRLDIPELIATNASILGWNAQDVGAKIRPTDAEVDALGPDFKATWDRDFKNNINKPLVSMALISGFPGDPTGLPVGQYISLSTFSVYPYSRGHIHINSTNPSDAVDFQTGFFLSPIDVTKHVWAYKTQREIMRRMATYRGELAVGHPPFPPESDAVCNKTDGPLTNVQNIKYTVEDDAIIRTWLIDNVSTTWHSLGTCKMAPLAQSGVVDSNLNVYGVQGLKIADMSIPPGNIAANTANTAFAIGERAADIFIDELRLGKSP
ncbi:FAD/NAD(P)-binding protein [Glarea lozoyensis ATCC 20868]|uniref:FAD/NAD(P)-binding protein n=1 Tax=Glarea lozoyensis (strain ATCC 20868 / MF5171) TaxID=1116229 RepID=S3D9B1_GLAL2|nr:FAD/NAD(P)-binding protein [Glarea lozoyensis ATCC 20868]EPE35077.1 FAD/NAD(P)-binding protein [Glarea lozoyensis ATCC 20868]